MPPVKSNLPNSDVKWVKALQNPDTGTYDWDLGD